MRIAVTGAGGFVGRALIALGAARGHEMIPVSRVGGRRGNLHAGSPVVQGVPAPREIADITDADGLRRAFDGCDAVVHCAARVHVMHHEGDEAIARFRAVNVEGTRAVVRAAKEAGAAKLVVLSTAKVLGEGTGGALHDAQPLRPAGAYAQSKAEAEELVAAEVEQLAWTIVRPPLVYGPGVAGNFRRLLKLAGLAATLPVPLGGVRNARSLVFVDNLADAILKSAGDARAARHRFLVSDGEDVSTADLMRRIGAAMGRPARLLAVPPSLLRTALAMVGKGAEADRLLESFAVDSSAIRRTIDWAPPVTLDAGIAATVRWWRAEGAR